jgi:uncharacterized protein (TIGR03083 family)
MDFLPIFVNARGRVGRLIAGMSDEEAKAPVPGTPLWTVHDVVAHLAGVTSDTVNAKLEGAGTPEWTARQVEARRDRSIAELVEEWEASGPALEPLFNQGEGVPFVAIDALTHEHDLRGALGQPGPADDETVVAVIGRIASMVLTPRLDKGGLPALRLVTPQQTWVAGSAAAGATVNTSAIELFRSLMGRRSAAQIRRYQWEGEPEPYFTVYNLFGPLPETDVLEAGAT